MLLALIMPSVCLLWVLTPFAVRQGDKAAKYLLLATYPRESRNGNNPASQKVHEGGGLRFQWLVVYWPAMALAGVVALIVTEGLLIGERASWMAFAQIAAVTPSWALSRRWVDIGEHAAEALHGDRVVLNLHAANWLRIHGFQTYSEGEIHRMTQPGQDYHGKPFAKMIANAKARAWAIGKLGSW